MQYFLNIYFIELVFTNLLFPQWIPIPSRHICIYVVLRKRISSVFRFDHRQLLDRIRLCVNEIEGRIWILGCQPNRCTLQSIIEGVRTVALIIIWKEGHIVTLYTAGIYRTLLKSRRYTVFAGWLMMPFYDRVGNNFDLNHLQHWLSLRFVEPPTHQTMNQIDTRTQLSIIALLITDQLIIRKQILFKNWV